MRIFAGDRVKNLMERMGMPDDEPIEHPWVTKSIENAQRKVEERNFDIRKNLLEYDDVMNAQRKTVYALRQALLLGRYTPEELDETGKPTGKAREVKVDAKIHEQVKPVVARLIGMFAEQPLQPTGNDGRPRPPNRQELGEITKLVELETLQREAYEYWGVKLELDELKRATPVELHDELVDLVARGLSEQRERLLDLIDRVVCAIIEDSCPQNKLPEDWDWKSVQEGFREHFKAKLDKTITEFGDTERLARELYARAEVHSAEREVALGVELSLRYFRHIYLEAIDEAWVDHLSNMEHLRDGIGLRGYGQRDPKNEYKKEGYNLFLNMMAKVSSTVLVRLFEAQIQRQEEIEALEAAALERHHAELEQAIARHPAEGPTDGEEPGDPLAIVREAANAALPAAHSPTRRSQPKVGRNDPCPCGSGKKFKLCHGRSDDEDEEQPTA
jgi:preprotein translocase subunit SecA